MERNDLEKAIPNSSQKTRKDKKRPYAENVIKAVRKETGLEAHEVEKCLNGLIKNERVLIKITAHGKESY